MYYSKFSSGYVLRIEIGEEVQEALRQFAQSVKLKGAFYQGIGALTQVELAYFRKESKSYERRFFNDDYELISLTGNLSSAEGSPAPHTHVTLGDQHFHAIAGHLVSGIVSITAEIFLTPVDLALTRKEDPILKYEGLISPNRVHLQVQT